MAYKPSYPSVKSETTRHGDDGKTLSEYWHDFKQEIEARRTRGTPELPTGIDFIDDLTDGIHRGELWTIAGSSGGGKTSLALQIATNIARLKKRVLIVSLEMRGEALVGRIFCQLKDYDNQMLKKGDYSDGFMDKDKDFVALLTSLDMEIAEYGYNFEEIVHILENFYTTEKPDMVVVDFVQLIDWQEVGDERLALQEYVRKLAELSKTKNLAILIVSQLRRPPSGADLNRPRDITDLKGTGSLEQLSHVVILISKRTEERMGRKSIKWMINVAKNREGATGECEFYFKGAEYKFKQVEIEATPPKDYYEETQ